MRSLCEKFVCVRLVEMNGLDLKQFQFDFDMTWAALFLHPDGTVLARYGTASAAGPMEHNSQTGLLATMREVLRAYEGYPANRHLFEKKIRPPPRYRRPEEIPDLRGFRGVVRVNRGRCIHCHNVHEALDRDATSRTGKPEQVFKYPLPDQVGLILERDSGRRVGKVLSNSAAAKAGIRAGDVVETVDGQAVLSIADFQFALHALPDSASVTIELTRGKERRKRVLELKPGWRRHDFTWRKSMTWFPPDPGLYIYALDDGDKKKHGVNAGSVALEVRGLFSASLEKAGLREGDVIVEYDGRTQPLTAQGFRRYVRLNHYAPGSTLKLKVLRGGKHRDVEVRL